MDKKSAHFTLAIFDVIAVISVYWVMHRYNNFTVALENNIDVISFSNRLFFYIGALIAPIAHIMAVLEATATSFFETYIKKIANLIYFILVVLFFMITAVMSSVMKSKLENASYQYCDIASKHQKLSSELVYVKDMQLCSEKLKSYRPIFSN